MDRNERHEQFRQDVSRTLGKAKNIWTGWNGPVRVPSHFGEDTRTAGDRFDDSQRKADHILNDLAVIANTIKQECGPDREVALLIEMTERIHDAFLDAWVAKTMPGQIQYDTHKAAGLLEPPEGCPVCLGCWGGSHVDIDPEMAAGCECCAKHPTR